MSVAPRVSVVMSVYNGRSFIHEAVKSVLAQTFSDFEFIIIDDGSTDGSTEILRQYAKQDIRIRLFIQENVGLTESLNRGLQRARGEYIARMDDDDVSLPERFGVQVGYLDDHPRCVAVGGQVILINEHGHPIENSTEPAFSDGKGRMEGLWTDHASIERGLLDGAWPMLQSAVMMRREAIEAVGGYDERFVTNQDHDLFLRLAEKGKLTNLPETVVKYRRHGDQITAQSPGRNFSVTLRMKKIRREAYQRRDQPLPGELQWPSIASTALRKELSKTELWPHIRKVWDMVRSNWARGKREASMRSE